MPSLAEQAQQAIGRTAALLSDSAEDGDLVDAVVRAMMSGHILYLIAAEPYGRVAEAMATLLRDTFDDPTWPPLFALTAESSLHALVGREYGPRDPLCCQSELFVREGDVALLLPAEGPAPGLVGAARVARSQGATVAGLGHLPAEVQAQPRLALPEAPEGEVACCLLAIGEALAAALAERLPAQRPDEPEPAIACCSCANCGGALAVPRHLLGRRGTCPHCHNNTALDHPPHRGENESRVHMRFGLRDCGLRVSLAPEGKPRVPIPGTATVANLSRGGLLFALAASPVAVEPGDPVLVELTTPAFERPLTIRGTVRRVCRDAAGHYVGVVFASVPPAVAERLCILERNLVLRNLARPPAPCAD